MKRWEEAVEDFRRNMEEFARTGNCEDRDCEIYGIQRTPPSRCGFYLRQ